MAKEKTNAVAQQVACEVVPHEDKSPSNDHKRTIVKKCEIVPFIVVLHGPASIDLPVIASIRSIHLNTGRTIKMKT